RRRVPVVVFRVPVPPYVGLARLKRRLDSLKLSQPWGFGRPLWSDPGKRHATIVFASDADAAFARLAYQLERDRPRRRA
ncbi:MAG TPA: hypothetical protein VN668_14015, partial [Stellaceae bacterium]|nr:hypothetical protein [Stellaceae bacterium]